MNMETLRADMVAAMKAREKEKKEGHLFSGIGGEEGGHRRRLPGGYSREHGRSGDSERTEDR